LPQIGPLEILVVAVVALIVFGPEKLPEIARSLGKAASELRRVASEAKSEFESGLRVDEDDESGDGPSSGGVGAAPSSPGETGEGTANETDERSRKP
jgi:Tat protein translocase TatB subunit